MPRALWSGSVSFGLVNVPIALLPAAQDKSIRFREVHATSHKRLRVKRVSSKDGKEVAYEHIAHGFDTGEECVMLTDDELERLAPRRSKTIDIDAFSPREDIDPALLDHPYLVVPRTGEGAARAYALLVSVMEKSDQVAIGSFVLRTREHLAALYVRDGVLALSTMLWAGELRDPDVLGDARFPQAKPSKKAVTAMGKLVEEMTTDFDPGAYPDRHRKRMQRLIAKKRKGGEIPVPDAPEEPVPSDDLLASLTASLERVRAGAS